MNIRVGILTAPHISLHRNDDGTTTLHGVRIGIGFHWDRREDQVFEGQIDILRNADGTETAVNTLDIEDYLTSVISSEMATTAPMELLKAHAVISRSWAMHAIGHTDHVGFDVCADDHCQRYEGILRRNERAIEAVRATAHEVLRYGDAICDCRYHKCCGGRTEVWRTCWEDMDVPYIRSVECPYCDPKRPHAALAHSLNDYDQETQNYHDWQVTYTARELGDIVRKKSGIDFGDIVDLIPLRRGASGRIYELQIVGTKRTETIGKELRIRQYLSPTCLYSSWFDVRKTVTHNLSPVTHTLIGHGWGHGAGLCQIGAAVMASEGATYRDILTYYYPGTALLQS